MKTVKRIRDGENQNKKVINLAKFFLLYTRDFNIGGWLVHSFVNKTSPRFYLGNILS